jgi:hypothetical protein
LPGFDNQPLVVENLGVVSLFQAVKERSRVFFRQGPNDVTTYAIAAPSDADDSGLAGQTLTLAAGPSTISFDFGTPDGAITMVSLSCSKQDGLALCSCQQFRCGINGDDAVCVESIGGSAANEPGVFTTTIPANELYQGATLLDDSSTSDSAPTTTSSKGTKASSTPASQSSSQASDTNQDQSSGSSKLVVSGLALLGLLSPLLL